MINLEISRNRFLPKFFPLLTDYSHRWEVYMGSAGSGKSYFIAEKILVRCCREKIRVIACRRYGTTLRQSVFALLKEIISEWKIISYIKINETDMRFTFPNGSEIILIGLDNEYKLLSLNNISCIWVEEAFEVSKDLIDQMNLRMRGQINNQQIILSFNPISKNSWLYKFCNNPPDNFIFHHSTYKDNSFLKSEYIKALEEIERTNATKARVFCKGEWGIDVDGLVFTNWKVEDFNLSDISKYPIKVGMDFGYRDATAIVLSYYDEENKQIYIADEFYKTNQTLDDILNGIVNMGLSKTKIIADAAEPRSIDFFKRKGINCQPCIKGQNSVQARIAFLQNNQLIVNPRCISVINELENFSYEKDRASGNYISDRYTHEFSHSIDALGYSYSDIYTRGRIRTLDKSILGI